MSWTSNEPRRDKRSDMSLNEAGNGLIRVRVRVGIRVRGRVSVLGC